MSNIEKFIEHTKQPRSTLQYRLTISQLPSFENSKILDYGSGLGVIASKLAENNEVIAIEPNQELIINSIRANNYKQIQGSIIELRELEEKFDLILCHNVLEYVENKEEYIRQFASKLKDNGLLSIVKHNFAGKVIQEASFEENPKNALKMYRGETILSENFGQVRCYTDGELEDIANKYGLLVINIYGIRMAFGRLKNREIYNDKEWQEKMYELEMAIAEDESYRKIAYFHHVLLKKK